MINKHVKIFKEGRREPILEFEQRVNEYLSKFEMVKTENFVTKDGQIIIIATNYSEKNETI